MGEWLTAETIMTKTLTSQENDVAQPCCEAKTSPKGERDDAWVAGRMGREGGTHSFLVMSFFISFSGMKEAKRQKLCRMSVKERHAHFHHTLTVLLVKR